MKASTSRLMTFGCDSGVPERNIALGYLFYILLGCLLLCLPWATKEGASATFIDHLFTVTSAVSTTGLATVDVPATYTTFGMVVILGLIQIGAIGYIQIHSADRGCWLHRFVDHIRMPGHLLAGLECPVYQHLFILHRRLQHLSRLTMLLQRQSRRQHHSSIPELLGRHGLHRDDRHTP